MRVPFQVGFCVNCGAQTWVKNAQGAPIKPLVGSKLIWLCLLKDDGSVGTRVGSLTLCNACDPQTVDCDDIVANLAANPLSGCSGDEYEIKAQPVKRIEVIKTFGE